MADLTAVEKEIVAGIVAPAFGAHRGKVFTLPADHEDLERELRCDLVLRAEDGEVAQFEHTRPAGETMAERAHPNQAAQVDYLIQQRLNASGTRGAVILLGWNPPPAKKADQEWIADWVCSLILTKLRRARLNYFAFDLVDDWETRLQPVAKWLSRIVIAPAPPDTRAGIIGSTGRMGHLIDDGARLREALEKKANHYGPSAADVILLVDFDTFPLQLLDVPEAVEVATSTPHRFKEVWALNNFTGNQLCIRLWPAPMPSAQVQEPASE